MTVLALDTQIVNQKASIAVAGRLEYSNRESFRAAVDAAIGSSCTEITVDLAGCVSIDAAALGCVITCSRNTKKAGAVFRLANLNDDLRQMMVETKLDTLFAWDDEPPSISAGELDVEIRAIVDRIPRHAVAIKVSPPRWRKMQRMVAFTEPRGVSVLQLAGVVVIEDEALSADVVHFVDAEGRLLGEISNLAVLAVPPTEAAR